MRFKNFIFFVFFVILFFNAKAQQRINTKGLIIRNGTAYTLQSDKPYNGTAFTLNYQGVVSMEGAYKNGKENGEFKYYFVRDGKVYLDKIVNFKDGKLNGKKTEYRKNPYSIIRIQNYTNNKKNGKCIEYFDNGSVSEEGEFAMDYAIGIHRRYFPSGKIMTECNHYKSYGPDSRGSWTNSIIENLRAYFENGSIMTKYEKIDSVTFKKLDYYPNGNLLHQHTFIQENPIWRFINDDCGCDIPNYSAPDDNYLINIQKEKYFNKFNDCCTFSGGNPTGGTKHMVGESYVYFENGKIHKKTKFFYPKKGLYKRTYYDGKTSNYETSFYTEIYNEDGSLVEKKVDGGFERENYNNLILIE